MFRSKIFMCLLLLISTSLFAKDQEPVLIQDGFVSGNIYIAMSVDEKTSYVMGVVDGLLLSPFLKAPETELEKLKKCLYGMENTQIVAIADKFLAANPERWHQSMHTTFWGALYAACFKNS
jgi:hypothetical protein